MKTVIAAAGLAAAPLAAAAQSDLALPEGLSFELSAGLEYDSNVSVSEIDNNTGLGDEAARFEFDLDYERDLGARTELDAGYSFSQRSYFDFSDFDLRLHFGSARITRDVDFAKIGGAYRIAVADLGGSPFLTSHQLSPYASRFIGEKLFVRADYIFTDKTYDRNPLRDTREQSVGGDVYYFLNGSRLYVALGGDLETSDADGDEFDFNAIRGQLRVVHRRQLFNRRLEARAGVQYEGRDYTSITPSIDRERADDRFRANARLEAPIAGPAFAALEYEYSDYRSNFSPSDFVQHEASLRVGARF
ncbi:MAG: hypothetical protein AAFV51_09120 [Pseudomonadota bacterium]